MDGAERGYVVVEGLPEKKKLTPNLVKHSYVMSAVPVKNRSTHYVLSLASDICTFVGSVLMGVAILRMNAVKLHEIQDPKKEVDELVDDLAFHRELTIAAIVFLSVGFGIRLVPMRVV